MGKKHSTVEQIAYALWQQKAGTPVVELTRKLGVNEQTFYRWKKKFAGLGAAAPTPATRRREQEAEAARRRPQPGQANARPVEGFKQAAVGEEPLLSFVPVFGDTR